MALASAFCSEARKHSISSFWTFHRRSEHVSQLGGQEDLMSGFCYIIHILYVCRLRDHAAS